MAFIKDNAIKRGDETVDTRFSPLLEPNLWHDQIFEAGRTFTAKYQLDAAGQIFVRKLGKGSVDRTTAMDFTHDQTEDTLISIELDEKFKVSEAIYEAVEVARTSGTGAQKMEQVAETVGEEWQAVAHEKLLDQSETMANTDETSSGDTKARLLEARQKLREEKAKPDVVIMSPKFYAGFLEVAAKEYTPSTNDEQIRTGLLGRIYGMDVYESNHLEDDGSADSTEFVMYEYEAYSILTQNLATRIVDASPNWTGSAAQVEIISGFKVTTPERTLKKVVTA